MISAVHRQAHGSHISLARLQNGAALDEALAGQSLLLSRF